VTTGSIYDLGYRGYDGPRLGRRHAVATLVRQAMRSVLGLGRTTRAKIVPVICLGLPALIALILVGIRAIAARGGFEDVPLIPGHDAMYSLIAVFALLFVAAQAPELLGRDQRYRVLTLYFSRALRRTDYALAKLVALTLGVLAIVLVPQLILSAGLILLDADVGAAIRKEAETVPAVLGSSIVIAFVNAAFALAIASTTPRRAYATAAIFGAFIIPGIVAAIVIGLGIGGAAQWIILFDVGSLLDGVNAWFFGVAPSNQPLVESGVSIEAVVAAAIILGLGSTAALVWRYLRIQA
jgi:ABC-2 type transport system permease protein